MQSANLDLYSVNPECYHFQLYQRFKLSVFDQYAIMVIYSGIFTITSRMALENFKN